jgi:hypothetical protein
MHPRNVVLSVCGLLLAAGAIATDKSAARVPATHAALPAPRPARLWSAAGGTVEVRWNRDLARDLGIRIAPAQHAADAPNSAGDRFALKDAGTLQFRVSDGYLGGFGTGALQVRGGYVLDTAGGHIVLNDFYLMPRAVPGKSAGPAVTSFDLVGADGQAWFYVDRLMHEMIEHDTVLAVRSSDVRISARLAHRLGQPAVAGWTIAELQLNARVQRQGSGSKGVPVGTHWHGDPAPAGGMYEADLFMQHITAQYVRCQGCSGENGSGRLAVTPSSTLRNNVNAGTAAATIPGDPLGTSRAMWTAGIPWYSKFSGDFPPYGNDQHPYLIWNMYRINADGSLEQIGRSGVKHAFLTTNGGCLDADDHDSHVLGRGCDDTYSVSNNDDNRALGPRSEILPASGQWGRCGSVFDTNCDGVAESVSADSYYQRLTVNETQISATHNPGASWLFESWYAVREDIDIYNSMATLQVVPGWTGSVWTFDSSAERLGAAIDRWVSPVRPLSEPRRKPETSLQPPEWSEEVVVDGGHVKIAVKVRRLGNGLWRYHYAVMNLDVAFAQTQGAEPDLQILDQRGFDGFAISTPAAMETQQLAFRDGDLEVSNDWQAVRSADAVKWSSGAAAQDSLSWGVLYSFSLTSAAPPRMGSATLFADNVQVPRTFPVKTIVPMPTSGMCGKRRCVSSATR